MNQLGLNFFDDDEIVSDSDEGYNSEEDYYLNYYNNRTAAIWRAVGDNLTSDGEEEEISSDQESNLDNINLSADEFRDLIHVETIEHGQYLLSMFEVLRDVLVEDLRQAYDNGDSENFENIQSVLETNSYWRMLMFISDIPF
jgi:hypothetical protein